MMRHIVSGILGGTLVAFFGALWIYVSAGEVHREKMPLQEVRERTEISLPNFGLRDLENELIQSIEAVSESVVSVIASKDYIAYSGGRASELIQEQVGGGSGMIISSQGYILTNKHVVEDTENSYSLVYSNGEVAEVKKIRSDKTLDIAILKTSETSIGNRNAVRIADFSTPSEIGQFVIAIGNALAEFDNSTTFGIISGNNRTLRIDNGNVYAGLLQTDASISEGNSGGPLFNLDGEVIAINTAVSSFGENIGFAIPLTQQFVDATLQSIKNNNEIVRPFVGVRYTDINSSIASELDVDISSGIYVSSVVDQSPAQESGLKEGDIITHLNNIEITTERPFLYQLFTYVPGDTAEITFVRNGEEEHVQIQLGR